MPETYWNRVHSEAWKRARERFGLTVLKLLFGLLGIVLIVMGLGVFGSADAPGDEAVTRMLLVVLGGISLVGSYLSFLVSIPAEWDEEKSKEIAAAKLRLTPRLALSIAGRGGEFVAFGSTNESPFDGSRQTMITRLENILKLTCRNMSDVGIEDCEALLVDVKQVMDDGTLLDAGFNETVALSWSRYFSPSVVKESIPPGGSKTIYVVAARPNDSLVLYRAANELPIEYHQMFLAKQKYRLWIRTTGRNEALFEMVLDVSAIPDPHPIGKGRNSVVEASVVSPTPTQSEGIGSPSPQGTEQRTLP